MNKNLENFLSSHPYAETTQRTYSNILSRLLIEWDTSQMSAADLLSFVRKKEWGNSRQCVALAASQKYIAWLHGQNHPALKAKIKHITGKPQRALSSEVALKLLASFNPYTPKGSRDLAICALALDTGLRCSELCCLQQADTDTKKCNLQVIVKGGQWKAAIFTEQTAAHVERWKAFRHSLNPQGALFVSASKHKGQGLTPEGLNSIIAEWGKRIGIKLSPHDLRRSMTTIAAENGAPDRALMEMGRWNSTDMPRRYTRTFRLESCRQYLPMSKLS